MCTVDLELPPTWARKGGIFERDKSAGVARGRSSEEMRSGFMPTRQSQRHSSRSSITHRRPNRLLAHPGLVWPCKILKILQTTLEMVRGPFTKAGFKSAFSVLGPWSRHKYDFSGHFRLCYDNQSIFEYD